LERKVTKLEEAHKVQGTGCKEEKGTRYKAQEEGTRHK
jgi:hypothetical protein